jgi:hypothetical protein
LRQCCSRGAAGVTGADMVRISRTLALEPWHFTQTAPASVDDPSGIVLDQGRRRVKLTLANAAHGCVFLLRTASGASCCGLGDLAPTSCRTFPDSPATGDPVAGHPPDCGCRERTEQHLEELTGSMDDWAADQAHWYETVARWNQQFAGTEGTAVGIEDFQRYLLEAQVAREAGTEWPEDVTA